MTKLAPYSSFGKKCRRCHELKHIQNFKRNGKVCNICNECFPENKKLFCTRCQETKHHSEFQMDSKMYQSCNKCRLGVAEAVQEAFNRGFNILNGFIGRNEYAERITREI